MLAISKPQQLNPHSLQQLPEPPDAPESRYSPAGLVAVAGVEVGLVGAGVDADAGADAGAAVVADALEVVGDAAVTPSQETR